MTRRAFLKLLAGLAALGRAHAALPPDGSRVAMVIGNNAYRVSPPLLNAANDARAMAEVLGRAGFEVARHIDAPAEAMAQAVRRFGETIERPQVKLALFYYAGHGAEIDWRNYLLPIDANVHNASELKAGGFDMGRVLALLPKARDKTFVIVLDACRDNPFGREYEPERKGLSPFDAPVGSLIAFSTSPGNVASDGTGANGLYTENLVRELAVPGLKLEDVFKRVRANVSVASRGAQIPWESTSLVDDVYVIAPPPLDEAALERRFEEEIAHWNRVKGSKDPADWAALLRAFPGGRLSEIAQAKLNALLAASAAKAAPRSLRVKPAYVRLGGGRPVPEYFARSANPFSAGTYPIDREFRVGDRAVYRGFDMEGGERQERRIARRVTRVDEENDRVEFNDGGLVTDFLGNPWRDGPVEYQVPFQVVPAELQVGRRWSARLSATRRGQAFGEEMAFEVAAREKVRVPAGEFDAFRIEARVTGTKDRPIGQGPKLGRRAVRFTRDEVLVAWEVPGLNFPVKQSRTILRLKGTEKTQELELVSLEQGDPKAGSK